MWTSTWVTPTPRPPPQSGPEQIRNIFDWLMTVWYTYKYVALFCLLHDGETFSLIQM